MRQEEGPLVGSVVAAAVAFPLRTLELMGLLTPKSYLKKKERRSISKLLVSATGLGSIEQQ